MATKQKMMTIGGCLVMLLATLLPLVNVKSYRWNILDLPHKLDRLVENATYNTIGKVLVVLLVAFPLLLALVTWLQRPASNARRPALKLVALLPLLVALAVIVLLLLAGKPSPGIGLWLYAFVATATLAMTFRK